MVLVEVSIYRLEKALWWSAAAYFSVEGAGGNPSESSQSTRLLGGANGVLLVYAPVNHYRRDTAARDGKVERRSKRFH